MPPSSSSSTTMPLSATKQASKLSKVIVLRLPSAQLSAFPHEEKPVDTKPSKSEPSSSTISSPPGALSDDTVNVLKPSESADTVDQDASAPIDGGPDALTQSNGKKRGVPGPKPGTKRTLAQANDGMPKPRGKPGPKKKPRPGDMVDGQPYTGPAPTATVKLNPKASAGAINDRLRALDRTGTPCRKWARKGFQVKSFTGVQWDAPSWKAPPITRKDQAEDVKSDSSVDGAKAHQDSSAVPSEAGKSNVGDTSLMQMDVASSPAPLVGTPA